MTIRRREFLKGLTAAIATALVPLQIRAKCTIDSKEKSRLLLFPGRYDADAVLIRDDGWGWCLEKDRSGRRHDRFGTPADFMEKRGGNWCLFYPRKGEGNVVALYRNPASCARWTEADWRGYSLPR